jgi:UDP-3-O-[3-hydroxymyristoyl] glucosamine N-acyltransferase
VIKDVPDGAFVTGIPARPHREWLRVNAGLQRLDQLRERLGRLEEAVRRLEGSAEGDR